MCKRKISNTETLPAFEGYTGETLRLSESPDSRQTLQHGRMCPGRFPWWTLWLIWPLIGLIKVAAPMLTGAFITLSQITVPLLPLVLVVVAILLLKRI